MHLRLLMLILLVTQCRSKLLQTKMLSDVVKSMKPLIISASLDCWGKDAQGTLVKKLSDEGIPTGLVNTNATNEIHLDHRTVFLRDISCSGTKTFLDQNIILGSFYFPYRWLIIGNSKKNGSCYFVPEQLSSLDIRVDSYVTVINRCDDKYVLFSIFKLPIDNDWRIRYYGSWDQMNGFVKSTTVIESLAIQRLNLHRTAIKVANVFSDPTLIETTTLTKELHSYSITIMSYNLISYLIDFMNATRVDYFTETWGVYSNSTWTGMMGLLFNNKADLGGSGFFVLKERVDIVDYLKPCGVPEVTFVLRRPALSTNYNLYLLPFNSQLWYSLLVSIVIMLFILLANAYWEQITMQTSKNVRSNDTLRANLSDVVLFVHSLICQQGSPDELKGVLGRFLMFIICLFFTFVYTSYSASIVALLQSSSTHIRTLEDLVNSKLEIGVQDTPYNRVYFTTAKDPVRYALYHKKIAPRGTKPKFLELEEGVKRIQKGHYAFFMDVGIGYKYVNKYFKEGDKCDLQEVIYQRDWKTWLGGRKKSPYKEMFKIGINRLLENGLERREFHRIYSRRPKCSSRGGRFVNVALMDCYPAFLVLIYGFFAAVVLLVFETILHSCRLRHNEVQIL